MMSHQFYLFDLNVIVVSLYLTLLFIIIFISIYYLLLSSLVQYLPYIYVVLW